MVKVLFVCLGNICRSPTAHGAFRSLLRREALEHYFEIDSAGTHAYHVDEPPDHRAQTSAEKRGIDLSDLKARRISVQDFDYFDYILAMDRENLAHLEGMCPDEHRYKVRLFLEFAPHLELSEVPDPYYGGPSGFERVLDMIEQASVGLLDDIRRRHLT